MRKLLGFGLMARRRGLVFAAHGVATSIEDDTVETLHIPFKDFAEVVALLEELDFDFLSLAQLHAISQNGFAHRKHWTHLTFDDGYQNNYDVVYPYLKARGIPFSVYVSTHHVQSGERFYTFQARAALRALCRSDEEFRSRASECSRKLKRADLAGVMRELDQLKAQVPDYEKLQARYANDRPIAIEDLKTMARDPLVHIGSHNHHHVLMHDQLNDADMKSELLESKRILSEQWKISTNPAYVYPNGDYGDFAARSARLTREHFRLAFVSLSGFVDRHTDPQLIPRFWISNRSRVRSILTLATLGNLALKALGRDARPHLRRVSEASQTPEP